MEIAKRAIEGRLNFDGNQIPLLGWCLGHQAIGLAAGWDLVESPHGPIHGVPSKIIHNGSGLYDGLDSELIMMRYNSLVLEQSNTLLLPNAWDDTNQLIMGISHSNLPIHGIQFHPESVGSPDGVSLLQKFLSISPLNIHSIENSKQV
tara:strand:- start:589 stop:1032 length:444 start_codon:yes stop_codon:yes gene_type:complete